MMVSLLECVSKGGSSRAAKQAQHTASVFEILIQFYFYEKAENAPSDLQLPLRQWGASNVYLLELSKAKR